MHLVVEALFSEVDGVAIVSRRVPEEPVGLLYPLRVGCLTVLTCASAAHRRGQRL